MIQRTLGEIAAMCGGTLRHAEDRNKPIIGVTRDSRDVTPDCLYIPLVGERFDGHDFAQEVLAQGAGGTLWQRSQGEPPQGAVILVDDTLIALQMLAQNYLSACGTSVVGVTGSNGKTTTKDMISALLETSYKVHKTNGNYNNHIGLPLTILQMAPETDIVVLEMGMSGRHEIELLSSIARPDVAVITNIGEAHLLQLGSRKEIARAKLEIISGLKAGGVLIYHGDEPLIPEVLSEPATVKPEQFDTVTFGMQPTNDDYPTGMMFHSKGVVFTSHLHDEEGMSLPLLGSHNVVNCLAALAVARHYKVNDEKIRQGLSELRLTGMRIEQLVTASGLTILNDAYNASPTAMKAAIDVLGELKGVSRKIAVLGDMLELGPKELEFHAEIGQYIKPGQVDILYTYGPLSQATADAARAVLSEADIHAFQDKSELIKHLLAEVQNKDVVLVKASRGMKLEEVVSALKENC